MPGIRNVGGCQAINSGKERLTITLLLMHQRKHQLLPLWSAALLLRVWPRTVYHMGKTDGRPCLLQNIFVPVSRNIFKATRVLGSTACVGLVRRGHSSLSSSVSSSS